jgi:hypothetical protein
MANTAKKAPAPPITYRTFSDAVEALMQLRQGGQLEGMIAKIVDSPYGGYRIRKSSVDLRIDSAAGGGNG